MEFLDGLQFGFQQALQAETVLWATIGVALGLIAGAAPGLGATVGTALVLPIAIRLPPEVGVIMMVSILIGSSYGNTVPSVLLRVPGTPSAILTATEGYPFQQRGEGPRALVACLMGSVIGQLVSVIVFIVAIVPLARWAVTFLFPEMFALVLFGLFAAVSMVTRHPVKGLVALVIGFALSMIGPDPVTAATRFGFGVPRLSIGLGVVPVLIGLLAIREVFSLATQPEVPKSGRSKFKPPVPSWPDLKLTSRSIIIGTPIGVVVGVMPGAGAAVSSFVAYQWTRALAKKPKLFGKGSLEALVGVDSAQNAGAAAELIPTLGLGIPGNPPMVLVLAALISQGLVPGPRLLESEPSLMFATFGGLLVATVMLAVLGYLFIMPAAWIGSMSRRGVAVVTLALITIGVYAIRWTMFDVWVAYAVGILGYFMDRYGYPVAPAALAFILGGMLESNLRRGLVMTDGFLGFFERPMTLALLLLAVASLGARPALDYVGSRLKSRREEQEQQEESIGPAEPETTESEEVTR